MFEKQIVHRNIVKVTIFVLAKLQDIFCTGFLLCIEIFLHFSQLSENVLSALTKNSEKHSLPQSLSHSSTTLLSTRKYKHFPFILIYCIFIPQIDVCSAVRLYPLCLLQNNWPVKCVYLL